MKLKPILLTAAAAAMFAGSASAQVYISSSTPPAAQTIAGGSSLTWDDSTSGNWATAIGGTNYTTWSGAASTIAGFTGLTGAGNVTINLSGDKTVSGIELYKNSTSGLQFNFAAGATTTLTVSGDINSLTAAAGGRTINFNSANLLLRGTYSVSSSGVGAGSAATLNLSSSAAGSVGGNMTLNARTIYTAAAAPNAALTLNMNGGTVSMGAFNTFGTGIAELQGSSAASSISVTTTSARTFRVNQTSSTTYAGSFTNAGTGLGWAIQKESAGTLTLTGDNSGMSKGATAYTTATINGGALVGGNNAAFGTSTLANVGVGASGTLGVANQANLGINNLTITNGAHFYFDLAGTTSLTDTQLLIGGNQTVGTSLVVDIAGMTTSFGQGTYTLATIAGTKAFSSVSIGSITTGWESSTIAWNGNNLEFTAVPEPGTWALVVSGLAAVVIFGPRRRRD